MRVLERRAQFLRAARGKKIAGRGFVLQAARVDQADAGIGFTVTRKVGNAPERNRLKRRLRAAARTLEARFAPGHDYVLIGRRAGLYEPFGALVDGLSDSLGRIQSNKASGQRIEKNRHE